MPVREQNERSRLALAAQAVETQLPSGALDTFWHLTSDRERMAFIWQQKIIHEVLVFESEYEAKSNEDAAKFREGGNKYFQQNRYFNALGEYNKCLFYAKEDVAEGEVNELSLAHANRSAALFHLKKYQAAIRDIDCALEKGYPKKMLYKIHERKGKCLKAIGKNDKAAECFATALSCIAEAELPADKAKLWQTAIEKDIAELSLPPSNGTNATNGHHQTTAISSSNGSAASERHIPDVSGNNHELFHSISSAVDVNYDEKKGRYFIVNRDIRAGEILVVEKPYASIVYEEFYSKRCYCCFRRTAIPVPCRQCSSICFCSKNCRDIAWTRYHQFECKYLATYQRGWCGRMGHLAARIAIVTGLEKMVEQQEQHQEPEQDKRKTGFNNGGTYANDYTSICSLVTNGGKHSKTDYLQLVVLAASLVKILAGGGFIAEKNDDEQLLVSIGACLLHYLQIIQCNAYSIQDVQNPDSFEDLKLSDVGIGLFSAAALINHSCDPNLDASNYGDVMVVRATRNIRAGEEATMSYGPLYYKERLMRRQTALKSIYLFTCRCEACANKWPVFEEIDSQYPTFRCEDCHKPLSMEEVVEERFVTCNSCGVKQDVADILARLGTSHELYSQAMQKAICGNGQDALSDLIYHMTLMQRCLCSPWRDMVSCQAAICNCYRQMAHIESQANE